MTLTLYPPNIAKVEAENTISEKSESDSVTYTPPGPSKNPSDTHVTPTKVTPSHPPPAPNDQLHNEANKENIDSKEIDQKENFEGNGDAEN